MSVLKYPEDGSPIMDSTGSPNQDYIVGTITGIHSDGGAW